MKRSNVIEKRDIITLLPDDIWNEILQFTFYEVGNESVTTHHAICSRRISLRLKNLIDRFVFATTKVIDSDVACWFSSYPSFTLNLFKNVEILNLTNEAKFYVSDLQEIASLKTLILNHNESVQFSELWKLTQLSSLALSQIYCDTAISLLNLTNLTSLELSFMVVSTDMTLEILPKLEHLSLCYCAFGDYILSKFTRLKSLSLEEDNNITGISFPMLIKLEKLSLIASDVKLEYLSYLPPSLKELTISHERGYAKTDVLRHLTKLERLHIYNSPNIVNLDLSMLTTLINKT